MNKTILEVSNVTKKVTSPEGELTIVNDISLSLEEGVFASILGPSGSGKTTLLAIMAGLDLPSRGSVKLLDKEITSLNEDKRAQIRSKDVGFVFQSFHLLPRLSALDNVMMPLEILGAKDAKERALKALDEVGLSKEKDMFLTNYLAEKSNESQLQEPWLKLPVYYLRMNPLEI